MATRTESRLGVAKAVSTTYVNVGTVAGSTTQNVLIHLAALAACTVRLYIAAGSWSSGEPTGADLVETIVKDMPMIAGEVAQITGLILLTGEKLIAQAPTGTVDVGAHGVAIT